MSLLTTSDVKLGTLSKVYKPHTGGIYKDGQWYPPREEISRFDKFSQKLGKNLISSNAVGDAYHKNYMDYLEICWSDHLGAVIAPDILWYTILCELGDMIKDEPEKYRSLFSNSIDRQEITIQSGSMTEMPMNTLISAMKSYVPTDIDSYLPTFSTTTERSTHAFNVAFADALSPYYDYSMYCCGIPYVDVRGESSDYLAVKNAFEALPPVFNSKWRFDVGILLNQIYQNLTNASFWADIFKLQRCGSGGQVEVSGWWTKLYRKIPPIKYTYNFSQHLALIKYKQLNTQKNYQMYSGLISSVVEDNLLVPEFGQIIYEQ